MSFLEGGVFFFSKRFLLFFVHCSGEEVAILVRKKVGNPVDFFDKTFDKYKEGFSANGLLKQKSIQSF